MGEGITAGACEQICLDHGGLGEGMAAGACEQMS